MESRFSSVFLIFLLAATSTVLADSPPSNTIPIISMKTGIESTCEDITMDALLRLLWQNFDGIWISGTFYNNGSAVVPATLCDSAGAYMIVAPTRLAALNFWPDLRRGRFTLAAISDSNAFIQPTSDFSAIADTFTAAQVGDLIDTRCQQLKDSLDLHDCIWYLDVFNEPSAWQLNRMLNTTYDYDQYFPSMYSQDTMMNQVLPDGTFSWIKYRSDSLYRGQNDFPVVATTLSMLHTIPADTWAGFEEGIYLGVDTIQQANSINAYFDMRYLQYDPGSMSTDTLDNTPDRLDLNAYPVRLAGYHWQTVTADSITVLGSATDLWMLEHYELLMDSTFIPAGDHTDGPFPINYHPQSYGRSGGEAIYDIVGGEPPDTIIQYNPYAYRMPSPAEFRMLCNIGLLRGAKAISPYSVRAYEEWDGSSLLHHDAGLLDENLIPYDDPYENWVYRDRPVSDYYYAPPDSLPPWTAADGSQFDPLYTLPSRPTVVGQKEQEAYLEWKFAPYARLWNSVRGTFRQIAWVAPELSQLWWWLSGDRYDNATISYDGGTEPQYFADPQVRVFTDDSENTCYLFYVNRFCRANDNPF